MVNTKVRACKKCGIYINRVVSIDAIIRNSSGQILLIKRKFEPYKDYWALPGGHVDWEESVENAVVREVEEETGLKTLKTTFFGVYSNPKRHPRQTIAIAYIVETEGIPKAGDDAYEERFYSLLQLPKPLAFDHKRILEEIRNHFANKP